MSGCATVPTRMSSDCISKIRNIAVFTTLEDDNLSVLDISGIRKKAYSKTYGGMMFGAIGGALEALIIEGVASYKIHSLIGGSASPVRESINGFDAKSRFDDMVYKVFSEDIKINRNIQHMSVVKFNGFRGQTTIQMF